MSAIVMILIGFAAGVMVMTIVSFYRWFLQAWNSGSR